MSGANTEDVTATLSPSISCPGDTSVSREDVDVGPIVDNDFLTCQQIFPDNVAKEFSVRYTLSHVVVGHLGISVIIRGTNLQCGLPTLIIFEESTCGQYTQCRLLETQNLDESSICVFICSCNQGCIYIHGRVERWVMATDEEVSTWEICDIQYYTGDIHSEFSGMPNNRTVR